MKNLYLKKTKALLRLFMFTMMLFAFKANAQCPPGDVTLNTQVQVDQFIIDYPNCTQISGFLRVEGNVGSDDITNLNSLRNIESINGYFRVVNTNVLKNLDGISSLTSVGGLITIGDNAELENIDGLKNLTSGGGHLAIQRNPLLTNLNGLSSLTSVAEDIFISSNPVLTDISALQNTAFAPFDGAGLTIIENSALAVCDLPNFCTYLANPASTHPRKISGNLAECVNEAAIVEACAASQCPEGTVNFSTQAQVDQFIIDYPMCTQIAGNLYIGVGRGTSDITDLSPLNNLTRVGGWVMIYSTSLTGVNGLSSLESVGGYFVIENNAVLTNLNGLKNVLSIGADLTIRENALLDNLSGLSSLTSMSGWLTVEHNAALNDISGLKNIGSGIGNLKITNNPALAVCNLPNFCNYLSGTGTREISGNLAECVNEAAVVAACAASQCPEGAINFTTQAQIDQFIIDYPNCTEIAGNLEILGNDITNLNGLSNIVSVTGYVGIYETNQLQNLNGLENLTIIGVSLDINSNEGLLNANGLSGLTKIGTEIQFYGNSKLQNISALSGVAGIGGGLWIIENPLLQNLNGLQNILHIGGDLDITENTILNDISALQNINPLSITPDGSYGLTIVDNPALAVCNLPNFCTYLDNDAGTHPRTISGNLAECVNEEAVVAACVVTSVKDITKTNISIYPNPAKDMFYFSEEVFNVKITDISGRIVNPFSVEGASVNISNLSKGIYLLSAITQEGNILTQKIIKE